MPDLSRKLLYGIPTIYVNAFTAFFDLSLVSLSISAINKKLDNLAQNMYIVELPLPHPGAKGGSSHGCDQFDIVENFRTSRRKSPLGWQPQENAAKPYRPKK